LFFKHRSYGRTKLLDITDLKTLFQNERLSYIKGALLFGSRADGTYNAQSDYDIAILTDKTKTYEWGVLAKAYIDIGDVLGLKEYDYDIVDLSVADTLIKESIKSNYKIIKGNRDELQRVFDK